MMISCREAARLAGLAAVESLSCVEAVRLRIHLLFCAACRELARQVGFVRKALRAFVENVSADPSVALHERTKARLREMLRSGGP